MGIAVIIVFLIFVFARRKYHQHKTKIDPWIKLMIFAGLLAILLSVHNG